MTNKFVWRQLNSKHWFISFFINKVWNWLVTGNSIQLISWFTFVIHLHGRVLNMFKQIWGIKLFISSLARIFCSVLFSSMYGITLFSIFFKNLFILNFHNFGFCRCALWPSSLFLSEFILTHPDIFSDKHCFEVKERNYLTVTFWNKFHFLNETCSF